MVLIAKDAGMRHERLDAMLVNVSHIVPPLSHYEIGLRPSSRLRKKRLSLYMTEIAICHEEGFADS
jgi:hypothetical protein